MRNVELGSVLNDVAEALVAIDRCGVPFKQFQPGGVNAIGIALSYKGRAGPSGELRLWLGMSIHRPESP